MKLLLPIGFFVNISLVIATYLRLIFADETLSFDYKFYLAFINEVEKLSLNQFIERVATGFPYFQWADFGSFEVGFAFLVYLFTQILAPNAVYASIACLGLYIKLEVMRHFKVPSLLLIVMYIFFVSLFESNALRAGISLSLIMLAFLIFQKTNSLYLLLLTLSIASLFHLSSLLITAVLLIAIGINYLEISGKKLFLILTLLLILPANMIGIGKLLGGKIEEYLILAEDFNLYTGASGLNVASLLGILFFSIFFLRRRVYENIKIVGTDRLNLIGVFLAYGSASLIIFSGILSIIGDRVWQMAFPILLSIAFRYRYRYVLTKYNNQIRINYLPYIKMAERIFFLALWLAIFYYVLINILFRYPQTNFFELLTGRIELIPPTVR